MPDDLIAKPATAKAARPLPPARVRTTGVVPNITASRDAILAELERRAEDNPRYRDWPEQVPGIVLGALPGHPGALCYGLDTHRLVLGKSGAGKATAVILPLLLHDDGHAVVVIDPKDGSIARASAGYRQQLGPVHIVDPYNMTGFFPDGRCDTFNPLDALDANSPTLVEDAKGLADALCYLPGGTGNDNQYWDRQGRSYLAKLILFIVTEPGETADLLRLREILTLPPDLFEEQVINAMVASTACDYTVSRDGLELQRALRASKNGGFEDVFNTIRSYMPWVEFQQLRNVTTRSTFDFGTVREQGGTVYIVMDDDRLETCASWLRLMLQSARLGLKRSASRRPVHFVIDEAAAFGKLELITTGLRAWRAAKIRLHLFYQSLGQIRDAFKDGWRAVSTDVVQYLGSDPLDHETREEISKIVGERDMIIPTVGDSTSWSNGENHSLAQGTSNTDTSSVTRTVGSNWSTAIGQSHTLGSSTTTTSSKTTSHDMKVSTSTATADTQNESTTDSITNTRGGSESTAEGDSKASGSTRTVTDGTNESTGGGDNRSFTLQLRKIIRPDELRVMPDDQMIVIAGVHEPAIIHKEHFFRNPRLVARAVIPFDRTRPLIGQSQEPPQLKPAGSGLLGALLDIVLPAKPKERGL